MRKGLVAVYAIARLGDDIADEQGPPELPSNNEDQIKRRLDGLSMLDNVVEGTVHHGHHPVFMAVQHTIEQHRLPTSPFHRLFEAFRRDASSTAISMQTWDEVLEYCHYSANPVGELMLRLSGDWSKVAEPYSNAICTALQITNFIQDVSIDLARGRQYLPEMPTNPEQSLEQARQALQKAKQYTTHLFKAGRPVIHIPRSLRLRLELSAIIIGGQLMLRKSTEKVLSKRPTLMWQ